MKELWQSLVWTWRFLLAWSRLSKSAVCQMSDEFNGLLDFHDYPDAEEKQPLHFHTYKCERCGKEFRI